MTDDKIKKELQEELEETLKKFYLVVVDTPRVFGSHHGQEQSSKYEDLVDLIFDDGRARLTAAGRIYDYIVLAPEKYQASSTKEQIEAIIKEKGKKPFFIEYTRKWEFYDPQVSSVPFSREHKVRVSYYDEELQRRLTGITRTNPVQLLELICTKLRKVSNDRADRQQEANLTEEGMIISRRHDSYAYDYYKCEIREETVYLPKAPLLQIISEALEKGSGEATLAGQLHYRHDFSDDMSGGGIDVLDEYKGGAEVKVFLRINEGKPSFDYEVKRREG